MISVPVDSQFGLYELSNGTIPISAHPVLADRLTTLVAAGVPFLQPPIVTLWEAGASENRYTPVDLEPGQIGWEVRASCVCLDNTRDVDGNVVTPPTLQIALFSEDLLTVLSIHAVDLVVPTLAEGVVTILEAPGVAQETTSGTSRSADPASREGLLWVATAARSVRHCVAVMEAENTGVVWLQLIPVWDHATPIADMDP